MDGHHGRTLHHRPDLLAKRHLLEMQRLEAMPRQNRLQLCLIGDPANARSCPAYMHAPAKRASIRRKMRNEPLAYPPQQIRRVIAIARRMIGNYQALDPDGAIGLRKHCNSYLWPCLQALDDKGKCGDRRRQ